MKKNGKLMRLCLILLLVFFSFSSGMVVSAADKTVENNRKAFSSIEIDGKKMNLKKNPGSTPMVTKKVEVKVKVKLKKGWKLKKISYYHPWCEDTWELKNGGKFEVSCWSKDWGGKKPYLEIVATKKKKTVKYRVLVYDDNVPGC